MSKALQMDDPPVPGKVLGGQSLGFIFSCGGQRKWEVNKSRNWAEEKDNLGTGPFMGLLHSLSTPCWLDVSVMKSLKTVYTATGCLRTLILGVPVQKRSSWTQVHRANVG